MSTSKPRATRRLILRLILPILVLVGLSLGAMPRADAAVPAAPSVDPSLLLGCIEGTISTLVYQTPPDVGCMAVLGGL